MFTTSLRYLRSKCFLVFFRVDAKSRVLWIFWLYGTASCTRQMAAQPAAQMLSGLLSSMRSTLSARVPMYSEHFEFWNLLFNFPDLLNRQLRRQLGRVHLGRVCRKHCCQLVWAVLPCECSRNCSDFCVQFSWIHTELAT